MRGLRITEPWNAARQAASNTEGIALDRIGLIQVDLHPHLAAEELDRSEVALGAVLGEGAIPKSGHQAGLQDDGLFGRALSLGQTFEAIAGNDNAGRSIEAKTGTVIEAGNLFKARVSARRRGGDGHDGSPVAGVQAAG